MDSDNSALAPISKEELLRILEVLKVTLQKENVPFYDWSQIFMCAMASTCRATTMTFFQFRKLVVKYLQSLKPKWEV